MDDFTKVWTDGSLVNHSAIDALSLEDLKKIEKILDKIKL